MPRRADRRAQATVEWAAVLVAVTAAIAGTTVWAAADRPQRIAVALDGGSHGATPSAPALTAAVEGRPGAISALGAQAWLEEAAGRADARRVLTRTVAEVMAHDHPGWGAELRMAGAPIRGRRSRSTARVTGPIESRVVSFADERGLSAPPTIADRAGAVATALGWQGAGTVARRVARPLGLAVSAIQLAVGLADGDMGLPPGARAGDIVVCRRALVAVEGGALPGRTTHTAWRTGVLRDGRLILDAVTSADPCRAPADR